LPVIHSLHPAHAIANGMLNFAASAVRGTELRKASACSSLREASMRSTAWAGIGCNADRPSATSSARCV
jgi:hypothetical protein